MKRLIAISALTMIASAAAFASEIKIEVPGEGTTEVKPVSYKCDGELPVSATYINAPGNALAVLLIGDDTVVTANVLAASGAKYAGGKYIWWTKGTEADLYDLTLGEDAPARHCVETS